MIEDKKDFDEFLQNPNREWDYVADELVSEKKNKNGVTFFVSDNASGMETFKAIKSGLKRLKETEKEFDLGTLKLEIKNVKAEDWENNWRKYFKPFAVGEKIIIKPSWEEFTEKTDRKILNIDPGHIFGTGSHETTQCCIELIEKYIKDGDVIADIGCGSGILSIASILLGAKKADAVDIDKNAVEIVTENCRMNNIDSEKYNVYAGDILSDDKFLKVFGGHKYDIIESNIVADVIIELSKMAPDFIKKTGIFICSGIISERLQDVYDALNKNGFEVLETKRRKDWCAIASKRK
jgi:ribosomal protein L11 methyltransferase